MSDLLCDHHKRGIRRMKWISINCVDRMINNIIEKEKKIQGEGGQDFWWWYWWLWGIMKLP